MDDYDYKRAAEEDRKFLIIAAVMFFVILTGLVIL